MVLLHYDRNLATGYTNLEQVFSEISGNPDVYYKVKRVSGHYSEGLEPGKRTVEITLSDKKGLSDLLLDGYSIKIKESFLNRSKRKVILKSGKSKMVFKYDTDKVLERKTLSQAIQV